MLCSSVVIGHKPYWIEFWTHLIIPGSNYVEVRPDWSNLLETYWELESNPVRAASIAQEARKTMDLLDPQGVSCYFRELIHRYSDLCQWIVEEPPMADRVQKVAGQDWMTIE